jgi:4a-hydroxytetrahydrobiopterin dehydratase
MDLIDADRPLTRTAASAAVGPIGWRLLLSELRTCVAVRSMDEAVRIAAAATSACGTDADLHLHAELRPDRVELSLAARRIGAVTGRDVGLARAVTVAVGAAGGRTEPAAGAGGPLRSLEIALDTMDAAAIRPFWKAVLGYADDPAEDEGALVDPAGRLPAVWFQQLDAPRPQRNRIHFDLTVGDDEADARIAAALAAGGRMVSDAEARAFWILADADGNEVCVCTWEDRDQA